MDGITHASRDSEADYGNDEVECIYDTHEATVNAVTRKDRKRKKDADFIYDDGAEKSPTMEEAKRREIHEEAVESKTSGAEHEEEKEERAEEEHEEEEKEEKKEEAAGAEPEAKTAETPREKKKRRRTFFDCKKEKEARTKQDFIKAQASKRSRCMRFVKEKQNTLFNKLWYTKKEDLYVVIRDGETAARVIVPEKLRASVIRQYHNSQLACHQGKERTWLQISDTFFWPGMKNDVTRWVKSCLACRRRKTPRPIRAGITEAALATKPNETIAMDIWGPIFPSNKGNTYVLTMIDTFTRWPVRYRSRTNRAPQ